MTAEITSVKNPLIKRIRSLTGRKYREREGLFFVEGIRAVEEAVLTEAALDHVVYAPERLRSTRALETIRKLESKGVRVTALSEDVFDAVSEREEGQGIGALVRVHRSRLDDLVVDSATLVIVLIEPRDPGNIGSIVRTAEGAGASGVIIVGKGADLYDPKSVRASMGALFALPVVSVDEFETFMVWAKGYGLEIIATSAHAHRSCFDLDLTRPLALVLGPERGGLDESIVRGCDALVAIPMLGGSSSLNLSAAAAVLIYEAVRQRMT